MPVVNPLARELVFKLVYYGPGLGGKTTSLQYVHAHTKTEHRGKMVSLATPVDRTLYFDFLPVRLPVMRGMNVRLQLFTVPGQVYYNATRKLVLTGADGVVLVVDSQRLRADANLESLENLVENLREHGRALAEVPHVIQYNKRDLNDVLGLEELEQKLNRQHAPSFETVAPRGVGVFESLEAITHAVLADFQRRMPEQGGAGQELVLPEGGIAEALRQAEGEGVTESEPATSFTPREATTHPSGTLRLSTLPEADPGEDAARAVADTAALAERRARSERPAERPKRPSTLPSLPGPRLAADRSRHGAAAAAVATAPEPAPAPTPAAPAPELGPSAAREPGVFAAIFPPNERALIRELELFLAEAAFDRAVLIAEQLVARAFASAASVLGGSADAPRDPALVCVLLGLDGRRYLEFRVLVRDTRAGRAVAEPEALAAYSFAIDARLARSRLVG
jgi:mutual gliding-motility protein MglA